MQQARNRLKNLPNPKGLASGRQVNVLCTPASRSCFNNEKNNPILRCRQLPQSNVECPRETAAHKKWRLNFFAPLETKSGFASFSVATARWRPGAIGPGHKTGTGRVRCRS
jgi:hypothetical protein